MANKNMSGKNRKERRDLQIQLRNMYIKLQDRFFNTATSIFSWEFEGLSKYYNELVSNEIERLLFANGMATIFIDEYDGILKVGAVAGTSKIGQYRQYVEWTAVMADGTNIRGLNDKNAIIIYNNKSKSPTRMMIEDDIRNMIDTDVSLSQHIKAVRVPFVFSGNENDMLTFKTIFQSVSDGEPVVFTDGNIGLQQDTFKVWNSDVNYKGDKLMMLYEAFENRVFTMLGIQSNRIDKKAQLGMTEVDKNDDVILVNFYAFKSERERARGLVEEVLGVKCSLNINEYLAKQNHKEENKTEGGSEDGKVYD